MGRTYSSPGMHRWTHVRLLILRPSCRWFQACAACAGKVFGADSGGFVPSAKAAKGMGKNQSHCADMHCKTIGTYGVNIDALVILSVVCTRSKLSTTCIETIRGVFSAGVHGVPFKKEKTNKHVSTNAKMVFPPFPTIQRLRTGWCIELGRPAVGRRISHHPSLRRGKPWRRSMSSTPFRTPCTAAWRRRSKRSRCLWRSQAAD